jgi:hypothetical protein
MDDSGVLRGMGWFTAERARVYAVAAALAWLGVLGGLLAALDHGIDRFGQPFGMDFASFWAASRLVLAGMAADVYLPAMHRLAEATIVPAELYEAFFYPPPYLLLCAPLALLPFFGALAMFLGLSGAGFAVALRQAASSPWAVLAALVYPAGLVNVIAGQNAMLTAALIGGGLTLMDRRPRLAGLLFGLMVVKPHLALAIPVALAVSGRWNVLCAAAVSGLGVSAASAAIFGWDVWAGFLHGAPLSRAALEQGLVSYSRFQSTFAVFRGLGAGVAAAYAAQAVSAVIAIAAIVRARGRRCERAVIVLAGLLMTPFVLDYDYLVLAFPLVWLLKDWSERGFPLWGRFMLLVQYLLPVSAFVYAPAHLMWAGAAGFLLWLSRGIE